MVVPNCRVIRLGTVPDGDGWRVSEVQAQNSITGERLSSLPVGPNSAVVVALGTIESTRLALLSFGDIPKGAYDLIGTNLLAHLRSNLTVRIPREALIHLGQAIDDLQQSALFVKGRHANGDGTVGHFHLQITASAGGGGLGTNSDAELFMKAPDIDLLQAYRAADRGHVAITIRSIGEMQPQNPDSRVTLALDQPVDEAGVARAFVALADPREPARPGDSPQTINDRALWDAMDQAAEDVANALAGGQPLEVLARQRDGLGTTHHEAGTLWMGDNPGNSVTDPDGRFHHVGNAYVAGPALFPTTGSPNPMLTGTALARRTADRIVSALPHPVAPPLEAGFEYLFDGTERMFNQWQRAGFSGGGPGTFALIDGTIVAYPDSPYTLLVYGPSTFADFILRLEFRLSAADDNSGVYVRFRYPFRAWPDLDIPNFLNNRAEIATRTGFEVQIDERAGPDGLDKHRTGAIYDVEVGAQPGQQAYQRGPDLQIAQWNSCEVQVTGDTYVVHLNGQQTASFTNQDPNRGRSPAGDTFSGYLGVQAHTGRVAFRNIRVKRL
jgi:hypothetical protein